MKRQKLIMAAFTGVFVLCMSLPFLLPHCGFMALFGFIPLLYMDRIGTISGIKRLWIWHYCAFVLWNACTTFWVCNATIAGGIFAILANALQMSIIFGIFKFSKKNFKGALPYIFLAVTWIAWERAYLNAEISWPWLVLGNAFAQDNIMAQWYEYTGTLGGSAWIWAVNLSLYGLFRNISIGKWHNFLTRKKISAVLGYLILLTAPILLSRHMYNHLDCNQGVNNNDLLENNNFPENNDLLENNAERNDFTACNLDSLEILIAQPNFDPYHKFEYYSQAEQTEILLNQIEQELSSIARNNKENNTKPLLILAPETFTNDVYTNSLSDSKTIRRFNEFLGNYPNVNILFGASAYDLIKGKEIKRDGKIQYSAPNHTSRHYYGNIWLQSHNSALITDGTGRAEIFHKSKLVPGVEYMPYPGFFGIIDKKLGGVIGKCIGQKEISLLNVAYKTPITETLKTIPIGCAICYESIYGEYCTGYVKAGAKALTIITNDAWWGDTPGYKQHLSYASLRAIELRRDIARCANTGISAIINKRGDVIKRSNWWKQENLIGKIGLSDKITFFAAHGDITGRLSTFIFLLMLLALIVRNIIPEEYRKN